MKSWVIAFSGSCEIKADTEEEAKRIFWERVDNNKSLPLNLYDIEDIGEAVND